MENLCRQPSQIALGVAVTVTVLLLVPTATTADDADRRGQQILDKLEQPAPAVDFNDTPLEEVVAELRQKLELPILIDTAALDELGIPTDSPITFAVANVRTRSMLTLLLRELELTYLVRGEVLLITTYEEAETELFTVAYDVADLIRIYPGQLAADLHSIPINNDLSVSFESLKAILLTTVAPHSWDEVGGLGSLAALPPEQLVVRQTQAVHREIEATLAALRKVPVVSEQLPYAQLESVHRDDSQYQQQIRIALENPVEVSFIDVPLEAVVRSISQHHDTPIVLDRPALDELGVPVDSSVTFELSAVSLRATLERLLREIELDAVITDDVLLITTPEQAQAELSWVVYPVNDFVYRGQSADNTARPLDYSAILETVTTTVAPESWDEVGGAGAIRPFPQRAALVVHQTPPIHREIERLLHSIRDQRAHGDTPIEFHLDPAEVIVKSYQVAGPARDAAMMLINRSLAGDPAAEDGEIFYVTAIGDEIIVRNRRAKHEQLEQLLRELMRPRAKLPLAPPTGGGGFFQHP